MIKLPLTLINSTLWRFVRWNKVGNCVPDQATREKLRKVRTHRIKTKYDLD